MTLLDTLPKRWHADFFEKLIPKDVAREYADMLLKEGILKHIDVVELADRTFRDIFQPDGLEPNVLGRKLSVPVDADFGNVNVLGRGIARRRRLAALHYLADPDRCDQAAPECQRQQN